MTFYKLVVKNTRLSYANTNYLGGLFKSKKQAIEWFEEYEAKNKFLGFLSNNEIYGFEKVEIELIERVGQISNIEMRKKDAKVLKVLKTGVYLDKGRGNTPDGPFDPITGQHTGLAHGFGSSTIRPKLTKKKKS